MINACRHFAVLCVLLSAGCAGAPLVDVGAPPSPEATGAALSLPDFDATDVVGLHLEVERRPCGSESFEPFTASELVDLVVVEQAQDFAAGATLWMPLEPGCYDLTASPASAIDGDLWEPSEQCAAATARGVEIQSSGSTSVLLVSQCLLADDEQDEQESD